MHTDGPQGTTPADSGRVGAAQQSCTAQALSGAPCRAFALPGRDRCAVHDPERAAAVRAARSKGGHVRALQRRRRRLDTPAALVKFTAGLIQDALDGTTPLDVARVGLYGVSIQRQLVEAGALEERIAALEELAAASQQQPRRVA